MFICICIIIGLFLIAKVNKDREWLPSICFFGIFATSFYLFYSMLSATFVCVLFSIALTLVLMFLAVNSSSSSGSGSHGSASSDDVSRYRELVRFIAFCKKIAPLTEFNQGIQIAYETQKGHSKINNVYATFSFIECDQIRFAREFAQKGDSSMVEYQYKDLSERAGLDENDWPYGYDSSDFAEIICGYSSSKSFTFIPPESNHNHYGFRVQGGFSTQDATQVCKSVLAVLKSNFPELNIKTNYSSSRSMMICIKL